jgi:hypothetical protein
VVVAVVKPVVVAVVKPVVVAAVSPVVVAVVKPVVVAAVSPVVVAVVKPVVVVAVVVATVDLPCWSLPAPRATADHAPRASNTTPAINASARLYLDRYLRPTGRILNLSGLLA